jgi:hypothetical protein
MHLIFVALMLVVNSQIRCLMCQFVLGNIFDASSDSREWRDPFVMKGEILGEVIYVIDR